MTEQIPEYSMYESEVRSDPYERVQALINELNTIKNDANKLSQIPHASPQEVDAVLTVFSERLDAFRQSFPDADEFPLVITGEGMSEVNYSFRQIVDSETGETHGQLNLPNHTQPFSAIAGYESRNFTMNTWHLQKKQLADDDWRVDVVMFGDKICEPLSELTDDSEPFYSIGLKLPIRISSRESDREIESIDINDMYTCRQALHELYRLAGDDGPVLAEIMEKLDDALESEGIGFTEFPDMDVIRILGTLSADYAQNNTVKLTALTNAVTALLGSGRTLTLDGIAYSFDHSDDAEGEIVYNVCGSLQAIVDDIPVQSRREGRPAGLTFILKEGSKLYSLPFTNITKMLF